MAAAVLRPASVQAEAIVQLQGSALESTSTSARSLGDLASGPGPSTMSTAALSLVRRGPKRSPIANLFGSPSAAPPARAFDRDSSEAVLVEPADPIPEPDSLATTPLAPSDHSPESNLNYGINSSYYNIN